MFPRISTFSDRLSFGRKEGPISSRTRSKTLGGGISKSTAPSLLPHLKPSRSLPLINVYTHEAPLQSKVLSIRSLEPNVDDPALARTFEIELSTRGSDLNDLRPGHHVGITFEGKTRWYSPSRIEHDRFYLTITRLEDLSLLMNNEKSEDQLVSISNKLVSCKKDHIVLVEGPHSNHKLITCDPDSNIIAFCTGAGIAPMRAALDELLRKTNQFQGRIYLYVGYQLRRHVLYLAEFRNTYAKEMGKKFKYRQALSRERHPQRMPDLIVPDMNHLVRLLQQPGTQVLYLGIRGIKEAIMDRFQSILKERRKNEAEISSSLEKLEKGIVDFGR